MSGVHVARVAARIRADIISGGLEPGARLTEKLLAERYEVSRVPIREALRILSAEGLVTIRPYAGASVADRPDDDAADLFAIRIELEAATARRAGERCAAQTGERSAEISELLVELERILAEGDQTLKAGDLIKLAPLNSQFHQRIAELSGSQSLVSLLDQISGRIEWLYAVNVTKRGGEAWAEHHLILDAVRQGQAQRAEELMRHHVAGSRDSYFKYARPSS
ncbi:GntR family transcriptional regulator [Nesterenkonia sp. MY13]|uniref:GntR family transcriptional regulator n=1 Tax=Nesterenkonia sedimenti TaxID=1463632 RepID=A0A7X8TKM8_9MICC|nr:GntR family transcriptional regulator [Nesterenkonia sedimenti]NLS10305.1 GntR family transcriptional regulator [Nesterenkonia sedimenti]